MENANPKRLQCRICLTTFTAACNLANHANSNACDIAKAALETSIKIADLSSLRGEASWIRKKKILAFGQWRYEMSLSQSSCSTILSDVQDQTSLVLDAYVHHMHEVMSASGVTLSQDVTRQLDIGARVLLDSVTMPHGAASRDSELAGIVRPVPVQPPRVVGHDDNGDARVVVDIQVEDSLEKMLQMEGLAAQAIRAHQPEKGVLREPRDGSSFRDHPLFRSNPGAFCWQLYAGDTPLCVVPCFFSCRLLACFSITLF